MPQEINSRNQTDETYLVSYQHASTLKTIRILMKFHLIFMKFGQVVDE